jgi:hypothetical protein
MQPHLEFNNSFLHPDKKTGIAEYGPFGRTDPALHPETIKVGIIGTRATADSCQQWIEQCKNYIETDRSKTESIEFEEDSDESVEHEELAKRDILVKGLAPDFIRHLQVLKPLLERDFDDLHYKPTWPLFTRIIGLGPLIN